MNSAGMALKNAERGAKTRWHKCACGGEGKRCRKSHCDATSELASVMCVRVCCVLATPWARLDVISFASAVGQDRMGWGWVGWGGSPVFVYP